MKVLPLKLSSVTTLDSNIASDTSEKARFCLQKVTWSSDFGPLLLNDQLDICLIFLKEWQNSYQTKQITCGNKVLGKILPLKI